MQPSKYSVDVYKRQAQGRRGEQDRLPRGQERAVRRERHAEIQRAADLQQLRQLRVQQRLAHHMQVEVLPIGPELCGKGPEGLRRHKGRGPRRPGTEAAGAVAAGRDLKIQP